MKKTLLSTQSQRGSGFAVNKMLALIALFCMTAIGAWAQDPDWLQAGDTWDASTKTLTVNNNPGKDAYDSNTEIQHVVFAANVTFIGKGAFFKCENLESVTFADGTKMDSIGVWAFSECGKLTTITIPASVTTIDGVVFEDSGLQTIFFEEGSQLKTIGNDAFANTPLTAITIPASVTTMERAPFRDCGKLTTVIFAENSQLETISEGAFKGCYALPTITIPASVTTIDEKAFQDCDALKKMIIPANVTNIGYEAFSYCDNLSVIYILAQTPPTLDTDVFTGIAENFRIYVPRENVNAYKTAYPDLADRIKQIMNINSVDTWLQEGDAWDSNTKTLTVNNDPGENAYSDNTEIQHIVFADNVTNIGKAAFDGCGNLESVTFAENSQLETINGWAFGYCGKLTTITIPASVITLNGPVFTGSGLQTIFFEEGSRLQTIGNNAFDNSALTAITIPASVITINLTAFSRCAYLSTVNFEENSQLETIDHGAFMECYALKKITIPANVTFIGDNVFDECQNLSVITILAQTPPSLGTNAFAHTAENFRIYVPRESVDAYKTAYPDLADRIKQIMDINSVDTWLQEGDAWDSNTKTLTVNNNPGKESYDYNTEIQHIVFAANVTFIDQYAFKECGNLESVTFAENSQLETISSWAFFRCGKLTTITIPASVTTLKGPVFRESGLQTIFFEEGSRLQTIGNGAFDNIPLTAISIPASVTSIGDDAFGNCAYLETVTFANDSQLESIGDIAFWYCYALKKITIPASVTSIGDDAFDNCPNLAAVTILAQTPPTLGKDAFIYTAENFRIYVPRESVDAYKTAYSDLADRIKPIMDLNSVDTWLQEGDAWDASTKTLTVNNNPGEHAYADNTEIQHLVFADNVTFIGRGAFEGCENLESVTFAENSQLETIYGWAFSECKKLTTITIPASVTNIDSPDSPAAFQYSGLQTIFFEEGSRLQAISMSTFHDTPLTAITIPASVTTIESTAFADCAYLSTVIFAENSQLETIETGAFMSCHALEKITIPASVTHIGDYAFDCCDNLSAVTILAQTPPTLGRNVFPEIAEDLRIYVPRESLDAYKTAYPDLADIIKPIMGDDVTGISDVKREAITTNRIYDLQGRRVDGAVRKGVYIINGKKVFIKK